MAKWILIALILSMVLNYLYVLNVIRNDFSQGVCRFIEGKRWPCSTGEILKNTFQLMIFAQIFSGGIGIIIPAIIIFCSGFFITQLRKPKSY